MTVMQIAQQSLGVLQFANSSVPRFDSKAFVMVCNVMQPTSTDVRVKRVGLGLVLRVGVELSWGTTRHKGIARQNWTLQ